MKSDGAIILKKVALGEAFDVLGKTKSIHVYDFYLNMKVLWSFEFLQGLRESALSQKWAEVKSWFFAYDMVRYA